MGNFLDFQYDFGERGSRFNICAKRNFFAPSRFKTVNHNRNIFPTYAIFVTTGQVIFLIALVVNM